MQDIEAGYWCNIKNNWANASLFFLQSGRRHPDCNFFFLQWGMEIPDCEFFFAVGEGDPWMQFFFCSQGVGSLTAKYMWLFISYLCWSLTGGIYKCDKCNSHVFDATWRRTIAAFFSSLTGGIFKYFFLSQKKKKLKKKFKISELRSLRFSRYFFFFMPHRGVYELRYQP